MGIAGAPGVARALSPSSRRMWWARLQSLRGADRQARLWSSRSHAELFWRCAVRERESFGVVTGVQLPAPVGAGDDELPAQLALSDRRPRRHEELDDRTRTITLLSESMISAHWSQPGSNRRPPGCDNAAASFRGAHTANSGGLPCSQFC